MSKQPRIKPSSSWVWNPSLPTALSKSWKSPSYSALTRQEYQQARAQDIVQSLKAGVSKKELARKYLVTMERIRQIGKEGGVNPSRKANPV